MISTSFFYLFSEIIKDLSCDFEDDSDEFCNYEQVKMYKGEWKRSQGNTDSSGLNFDHTRRDSKGKKILCPKANSEFNVESLWVQGIAF